MHSFNQQHDLISYYKISHNGPAIGTRTETAFSERSQDHMIMLKYIFKQQCIIFKDKRKCNFKHVSKKLLLV